MPKRIISLTLILGFIATIFPIDATAQTATAGLFVDDGRKITGTAVVTTSIVGSSMTGTVLIANQSLSLTATFTGAWNLNGTVIAHNYTGNVSVGAGLRPVRIHYHPVDGLFVANIVKPDIGSLLVYAAPSPAILQEVQAGVMEGRTSYATATTYNLLANPLINGRTTPTTTIPDVIQGAPIPFTALGVGGVLGGGVIPQSGVQGQEGSLEGRTGPRNNDYKNDALGSRLRYNVLQEYRDVRYTTSYDEVPLGVPHFKHMTFLAWSPDLAGAAESALDTGGTVRYLAQMSPGNYNGDPTPLEFYEVKTYPEYGYSSPVSFSLGVALGYGPLSAGLDLSVDFQDNDGYFYHMESNLVVAEVDYHWPDVPTTKAQAIGAQFGFGSKFGADGNYDILHRIVTSYYRIRNYATGAYALYYEIPSAHGMQEMGVQASEASAWTNTHHNGRLATTRDFDLGDRTVTDSMAAGRVPGAREAYYTLPWPGSTRTVYAWWQADGPICETHNFEYYADWFNPDTQRWDFAAYHTETVVPPLGQCYSYYRPAFGLIFNSDSNPGHYQVYLSDISESGERFDFLDVADFVMGAY